MIRLPHSRLLVPPGVAAQDPSRRSLMQAAAVASTGLLLPSLRAQSLQVPGLDLMDDEQVSRRATDDDVWGPVREALLAGLNLIPVVGGLFSYLGALFIPGAGQTAEQRWRAYTDTQISEALFRLIRADLLGLSNVMQLYRDTVESGDTGAIRTQSVAANTVFVATLPRFQLERARETLLPLFSTCATLHLALLRDMALKAVELGFKESFRQQLLEQQKSTIKRYIAYVDSVAAEAYDKVRRQNGGSGNSPLSELLIRRNRLQLGALDQRDAWHAFDAEVYPERSPVILDRELYSGVIGRWDGSGLNRKAIPDWRAPTSALRSVEITLRRVANIEVGFLDGVRMTYADGDELEAGQLAQRSEPLRLAEGERVLRVRTRWRSIQGLVSMELQTSSSRQYKVGGRENNFDVVDDSSLAAHQLSSIRPIGRGRASARSAAGACILGFQLTNRTYRPISAVQRARVAPTIAPRLMDWVDERH